MNYSIVKYIIGKVLSFEAAFMALPCITAMVYQEHSGWAFFMTALLCLILAYLLTRKKPENNTYYVKEGFVTVALSWIVLSIMGAIPFLLCGAITNPVDALFETVSGFTTTGASILTDVEILPKCVLMWRSFTHWIGGMGVLVFLLTFVQGHGTGYNMNLMKAESPGPSVSKLMPTVQSTAKILYLIYIFLTVLEIILLLLGGMPLFDALTTSFGTAGTGGFGIKNDSIGSYSPYLQIVVTVFMILFGINFNAYFFILCKKFRQAFLMTEVRCYLGIILAAILMISWDIRHLFPTIGEVFRHASFQDNFYHNNHWICHNRL